MGLFDKPLFQLAESDLCALIADKEAEGKTLDYKRDLVGQGDADKKEFLYDASSFANTLGGDLVFGMEEKNGLPINLVGVAAINPDKEILRLEQMLRDGIRPAITGVQTVPIPLAAGNVAIVMRIPKSWNPPHQVTFQKAFRFYARDTNGKYQVDVDELRSIFSLSGMIADRIRAFRVERVAKIAAGDTPVPLLSGGNLVLHVVPFSAFAIGTSFPLQEAARQPNKFPTLFDTRELRRQITFDGLLMTSNIDAPPAPQRAYIQVLRAGAVEAVASSLADKQEGLLLPQLQTLIIHYARVYAASLHAIGVEPPMAIFASLLNVKGMRLLQVFPKDTVSVNEPCVTLPVDQYHFVETIFETVPTDDNDAAKRLRVTLDHLANTAGLASSPYFDAMGNYTLKPACPAG
jgi:Putative DNA-binding domain